ncbi:hypothetical protein RclHR1_02250004 [Rhizophagus clarus]|uniref:Uncharacterized protein n=1 Tax=Rhizophagus clarus TaxID=94130 RepID=A0A2Z6R7Z7_9GLOM|nr:hypothetical protein RclHR1_02250004 [Rhizophagus clarus]GES82297.1 hypothetical protein GLOIN_2v1727591 [Rhizophagus clarus]
MNVLYEIKIEIFKNVDNPLSLALVNRPWYTVFHDPHARSEWLLNKYGRAHALFHAVRLGSNFLTLDVMKCLIAKKAILSRYFVQRLMLQCGKCDQKLLELRSRQNVNQENLKKLNSFRNNHWGNDLSVDVFVFILEEAIKIYKSDVYIKGNDIELLHFLTAGPSTISVAPLQLLDNIELIKDLILKKNFIPFPPSKNSSNCEYPRNDGYENARQLNILARAIVICPDLVKFWKQIGYHEICEDINDLVIQGVYLILFPLNPNQQNWICPDDETISKRLKLFLDLGFKLDNKTVKSVIYLFNDRLSEIGDVILKSFCLAANKDNKDKK